MASNGNPPLVSNAVDARLPMAATLQTAASTAPSTRRRSAPARPRVNRPLPPMKHRFHPYPSKKMPAVRGAGSAEAAVSAAAAARMNRPRA
jgi:hypothetical protein